MAARAYRERLSWREPCGRLVGVGFVGWVCRLGLTLSSCFTCGIVAGRRGQSQTQPANPTDSKS
eukprot:4818074-Prymnesium_polylepis.1